MAAQIVEQAKVGAYDMTARRTLAVDDDTGLGVLIEDAWCGVDSVEGECYRPYLYTLTRAEVAHVRASWDLPWIDMWQTWPAEPTSSGRYYGSAESALRRHVRRQTRRHGVRV